MARWVSTTRITDPASIAEASRATSSPRMPRHRAKVASTARRPPSAEGIRYGQTGFSRASPAVWARRHEGCLQPVDPDRLAVALLFPIADLDEIPGFQHLLAGLDEARFLAVRGWNGEETGQPQHDAKQHQRRVGMPKRQSEAGAVFERCRSIHDGGRL